VSYRLQNDPYKLASPIEQMGVAVNLYRNTFVAFLACLLALGALLPTSTALAGVSGCELIGDALSKYKQCWWNSDWGRDRAVRVTIGQDTASNLRWVASPIDNPGDIRSGVLDPAVMWYFIGTSKDDVMVEVPRDSSAVRIEHGLYSLGAPFWMVRGIHFYAEGGNDIIVGGNFTSGISTDDGSGGTNVAILYPNRSTEVLNWVRRLQGGPGTDALIVGPALTSGLTASRISLWGGQNDLLCNLGPTPAYEMFGALGTRIWGSAKVVRPTSLQPSVEAAQLCVALYAAVMDMVLRPVR